MVDRAYENAIRRRDALRRELTEIERFIEMWHHLSSASGEVSVADATVEGESLPLDQPKMLVSLPQGEFSESLTPRVPGRLSNKQIASAARDAILENGRPMTRGHLVAAFEARGLPVAGVDKQRNMGTIMWRLKDAFVNIPGHGYWPRDVPCEVVGYAPAAEENSASPNVA